MRSFVVLSALVSCAVAQNASYYAGLTAALVAGGNTKFADIFTTINGTNQGQALFKIIPNNAPITLFAPDDNSLNSVSSDVSGNPNLLANTIAYHIAPGNYSNATATSPNVTVARTLLNDTALVRLEGRKSQVIVFNKDTSNAVNIQNQPTNVTVSKIYYYQNVEVKVINAVLAIPPNITTVLGANGLSALGTVAASIPGTLEALATAEGYTLFAPTNDALTAAAPQLAGLQGNNSALNTVIGNHIINGTTVYSADLNANSNYVSAAGQRISFVFNSTGLFVVSGDNVASAQIVRSNILVDRGVIHEISGVLANTNSNTGAASSAFASATSNAAKPTTTNAGAGGQSSSTATSGSGNGNGAGAVLVGRGGLVASVVGVVGALMGGFLVL